ncbi:hypothetical protein ABZS86_26350 [Streptomyces sp. NPDC005355]|uniref:hypothetical protein n=1 Tax=Streptomyces sp. NPDC005355 TaxID=3157038 RepID=UPI0033A1E6B9
MSEPEQPTDVSAPAPLPPTTPVPPLPAFAPAGHSAEATVAPSGSRWARLSRTAVLFLGIGTGATAVGICWASLSLLGGDETPAKNSGSRSSSATSGASRAPAPFETDGTLTLADVGAGLETGEPCSGTGGYSDIDLGTQVNITDEDGTLVATGSLGLGEKAEAGCVFSFTVDDIAPGSKFYTVEVSHRGGLTQTEAALRAGGLEFTLGG